MAIYYFNIPPGSTIAVGIASFRKPRFSGSR